jgi:threonylcarbamoyladenosine tRNA methylthiotransferase MtaB
MGRPYGPMEFRDLVHGITRRFPGAGLGLDVLVGFPGETASDFEATRGLVRDLPVTYLHVFPYSPRPGTPAAALKRRESSPERPGLRELGRKNSFKRNNWGGAEVLWKGLRPRRGISGPERPHYLRVVFRSYGVA